MHQCRECFKREQTNGTEVHIPSSGLKDALVSFTYSSAVNPGVPLLAADATGSNRRTTLLAFHG